MAHLPDKKTPRTQTVRPPAGLASPPREMADIQKALQQAKPRLQELCFECFRNRDVGSILEGHLWLIGRYVVGAETVPTAKAQIRELTTMIKAARRLQAGLASLALTDRVLLFHDDPSRAFTRDPAPGNMMDAHRRQEGFCSQLTAMQEHLRWLLAKTEGKLAHNRPGHDPIVYLVEMLLAFWMKHASKSPTLSTKRGMFAGFVMTSWGLIMEVTGTSPKKLFETTLQNEVIKQLAELHGKRPRPGRPSKRTSPETSDPEK